MRIMVLSLALLPLTALASTPQPDWSPGMVFHAREFYRMTNVIIGPNGYLNLYANTRYDVSGPETYTQTHGTLGSVECWRMDMQSSSFTGNGHVDITTPLPLSGEVRVAGGSLDGEFWQRVTDLATVARVRRFSVQLELNQLGFWIPAGTFLLTENEEYSPALRDLKFPLELGDFWAQPGLVFYFFGSIGLQNIVDYSFSIPFPWPMVFRTSGPEDLANEQLTCPTYHITTESQGVRSTLDTWYCEKLGWFMKQIFHNVPLGPVGEIEDLQIVLTGSEHLTPTPAPSPSPTPEAVSLVGGYWNTNLTAGQAGPLTLMAIPSLPVVEAVKVLYGGVELPVDLNDEGRDGDLSAGDGWFGWRLEAVNGAGPVRALLEFDGRDGAGQSKAAWPYLMVR